MGTDGQLEFAGTGTPVIGRPWNLVKEHGVLLAEFEGFTFIRGESYASCMASLAEVWQPDVHGRHPDTAPGREIMP